MGGALRKQRWGPLKSDTGKGRKPIKGALLSWLPFPSGNWDSVPSWNPVRNCGDHTSVLFLWWWGDWDMYLPIIILFGYGCPRGMNSPHLQAALLGAERHKPSERLRGTGRRWKVVSVTGASHHSCHHSYGGWGDEVTPNSVCSRGKGVKLKTKLQGGLTAWTHLHHTKA